MSAEPLAPHDPRHGNEVSQPPLPSPGERGKGTAAPQALIFPRHSPLPEREQPGSGVQAGSLVPSPTHAPQPDSALPPPTRTIPRIEPHTTTRIGNRREMLPPPEIFHKKTGEKMDLRQRDEKATWTFIRAETRPLGFRIYGLCQGANPCKRNPLRRPAAVRPGGRSALSFRRRLLRAPA